MLSSCLDSLTLVERVGVDLAVNGAKGTEARGMTRNSIGFGVIAVGGIGYLHATNIAQRVPGARLVAVTDSDHTRADRVANELSADVCEDVEGMLARDDIEAVVIASPTSTHADFAVAAIEAGKHVLCEKPLSYTVEEADRVAAAVERCSGIFQVGFQRRHDSDWRNGVDYLRTGRLGRPRLYFSSYRERVPLDGDNLTDLLIHGNVHDLDAARWVMGEIEEISVVGQSLKDTAVADGGPVENLVTTLRFTSGALGVIDNGTNAKFGFECKAEVIGTEATMRISSSEMGALELLSYGNASKTVASSSAERFERAHVELIADFCHGIRTGSLVGASVYDGRASVALAHAAEKSIKDGRPVRFSHSGSSPETGYLASE